MRDDNSQQKIEQEIEQAFIEEMKLRIHEDIESVKQEMTNDRKD